MTKKLLTNARIKALKPGVKQYSVGDGVLPGLELRVNKNGTKVWSVMVWQNGTRQRVTLGQHPRISLSEARQRASDRKRGGVRLTGTVKEVFQEYMSEVNRTHRSWRDIHQIGTNYFLPMMGQRQISAITADDGVEFVNHVEQASSSNRAAKALACIRPFFKWAAGRTHYIPTNPWAGVIPPKSLVRARDRVLTNDELIAVWAAACAAPAPFGPWLRVLILSAQRRGEVAGLRWSEIDRDRRIWTIPGQRRKNGRTHEVAFSDAGWSALMGTPSISDLVFTSTKTTPISGFGRFKQRIDQDSGVKNWRFHDLRRTAATRMVENGVSNYTVSKVLGHAEGGVTAVYVRAEFREEKKQAMDAWSKFIRTLDPYFAFR